jgi:hypothetical protein
VILLDEPLRDYANDSGMKIGMPHSDAILRTA